MESRQQKREEQQQARLWAKPTLQNFWQFVKLGVRPDVKITSVKAGQNPLSFEKDAIKNEFYTEFRERWHVSPNPQEQPPKTCTDQGRFGQELDGDVSMTELENVISEQKNGKAIGLDSVPDEVIKLDKR